MTSGVQNTEGDEINSTSGNWLNTGPTEGTIQYMQSDRTNTKVLVNERLVPTVFK